MTLPDNFIVHEAFLQLPSKFSQMMTSYYTGNQLRTINKRITKCDAEEAKWKRKKSFPTNEKVESANTVDQAKSSGNKYKGKKKS